MKKMLTMLAVAAALCVSATSLFAQAQAQDNSGGNGGRRNRGGPGGGNFDPAQFQQRMMDNIKDRLGVTNDTDWDALEPLVQKVMDARRDAAPQFGRGGFGRRGGNGGDNGGGNGGGGNNPFARPPNPDAEALQQALDANAPSAQVNTLLTKYRASQKDKEAKLATAQSNLQKVLTPKQEAQAVLLGLLN